MTFETRLADLRKEIEKSLNNRIMPYGGLTLLAASKGQTAEAVRVAIACGISAFGENRVQEAQSKWPSIKKDHPEVALHLIGPLQTNKAKEALSLFDVIQTLDRPKLAEVIAKQFSGKSTVLTREFYIQVNTGDEPQKAGISPKEADAFIGYCKNDLNLPVTGLMCIPPADDVPAPHFALLREIAGRHGLLGLSMGMSADFATAIRMGSTCIRIGTRLFGERDV